MDLQGGSFNPQKTGNPQQPAPLPLQAAPSAPPLQAAPTTIQSAPVMRQPKAADYVQIAPNAKLSMGKAWDPFEGQNDINYFISSGNEINPMNGTKYTPGQVVFEGPDYLVNSEIFKNAILPKLERPVVYDGEKAQHDILTKEFKEDIEDIREAADAVRVYVQYNPGSTEKDAMVYLRNVAASQASDNDEKTQVVWGVNDDGTEKVASVKDVVNTFKQYDDYTLGSMIRTYKAQLEDPKISPANKAILKSLLQFAQQKKLFGASGRTQFEVGANELLANSDKGGTSWLAGQLTRIGNKGTAAEQARRDLADDPRLELENIRNASMVGSVAGLGLSVGGDIFMGGGIGNAVNASLRGTRIARAMDKLRASGPAGQIEANVIRETPTNLAIGALQSSTNPNQKFDQNFAIDTAITAGIFGAARSGIGIVKSLDTASNGTLTRISDEISKAGLRGLDRTQSLPLVGNLMKKFSYNFLDDSAGVARAARKAFANSTGAQETKESKSFYMEVSNALRQASMRGFPEAVSFLENSDAYKRAFATNRNLQKISPKQLSVANDYVVNATVLARIDAGQYPSVSKKTTEEIKARVASLETPELQQYRDELAAFNDDITKFEVEAGISNEDIINYMRESPEFADKYIHLQADVQRNVPVAKSSNGSSLKSAQPGKRIKGFSEKTEYEDPMLVAAERLHAVSEIASKNRVTRLLKNGIDNGWIPGRIVQDALLVKQRGALKAAVSAEREAINKALEDGLDEVSLAISRVIDDIEDPLGDGVRILSSRVDNGINSLVDDLLEDDKFMSQVIGKLPEGTDPRNATLEALSIHKPVIIEKVDELLGTTELGATQRKDVMNLFKERINTLTTKATSDSTSGIADKYDELRRLRNEIAPGNETKGTDVMAYFEDGGKGYIQVSDPDILEYFNMQKTIKEDGMIARLMTGASRAFRLGTTGINPRFLLVNASRDIPQSAILSGYGALSPRNTYRTLVEVAGLNGDEAAQAVARNNELFETSFRHSTEYSSARNPEHGYKLLAAEARKGSNVAGKNGPARVAGKFKQYTIDPIAHPSGALRAAEDLMGETELITRKNVFTSRFDTAVRRGQSVDDATNEALFYASETTANFLRRGARVRQIIRTMPYLSAAINGKASFMRLWALDPLGVTARLATSIAAPAIYITAQNLADPEIAAGYWEIPQYTRETNFIVMTGPDSYLALPMSYEIASVINPFREMVEKDAGMNQASFQRIFVDGLLNQSPIDLGGFSERDVQGNVDYTRAIARAGSSILPQAFKPIYESATGEELYTGTALGPSDQELIEQGRVGATDEITDANRTFASRNSRSLGFLANITGLPQYTIQNAFKNYTGAVGQYLINGIDKLAGAPEEEQGGRELGADVAKTFGGQPAGRSRQAFFSGLDKLEEEKAMLKTRLEAIAKDFEADPETVNAQRKGLIDKFGQKVADFSDAYGDYYQRVGGVRPYQVNALVRLLDFGPNSGTFEAGTYQADNLTQVDFDAQNDATRRAFDLGLPNTNSRDIFGQARTMDDGTPYVDYADITRGIQVLDNAGFGTPKQAAFEIEQLTKGDKGAKRDSLSQVRSRYYDMLNPLYAKAQGLKGAAATAVYNEISAVQEQYNAEVLQRLKPVIDKYGINVLRNNKKALETMAEYIMVPGDFKPFASKKKQPYLTEDSEAYLKDLMGVGALNASNVPTDKEVISSITAANKDLDSGKTESALYKLRRIDSRVSEGELYADYDSMQKIKELIALANKR